MEPTLFIPFQDRVVAVADGVTRIGRSLTADVELDDIHVSRRHALIVRGEGKAVLLDDGARHGVFLNGVRVDGAELQDGDTLRLGKTELRYAAAVRELTPA